MSNDLTKDPIELTDAGYPVLVRTGLHIIRKVAWIDPLAYEDRAYLLDKGGNRICDFTCKTPHENQEIDFGDKGQPFDGPFNLSILDSGLLLVYRY